MNPEERKLLEEAVSLGRKNNAMLHRMHRAAVWGRVIRFFYWAVIIAAAIGTFYFLEPYLEQIKQIYGQFGTATESFGNIFAPR